MSTADLEERAERIPLINYASDESATRTISVPAGSPIMMVDSRWYRCTDVNRELNRQVTRIGIALVAFEYDEGVGADNRNVWTFTVRQHYQRRRPSLDYTHAWLQKWLGGLKTHMGEERRAAVAKALDGPLRQFEKEYKNFQAEHEELEGSGLLSF